jgi:prepilin-type N-terminal cleavage/methylation domain-containing protein
VLTKVNRYRFLLLSRRGFTLLEIMIVMGLIGIFMAIALPNFSRAIPEMKVDKAARKLATDLRLAQQKAVGEMTDVFFRVEGPENRYYTFAYNRDFTLSEVEDPLRSNTSLWVDYDEIDQFRGVRLAVDGWIWFTPLGDMRSPAADAVITLASNDIAYSRQIQISYPLGKVKVLP